MENALENDSIYLRKNYEQEYLNRVKELTFTYNSKFEAYYRIQAYNNCPKEIQIKEITIDHIKKEILKVPIVDDSYVGFWLKFYSNSKHTTESVN